MRVIFPNILVSAILFSIVGCDSQDACRTLAPDSGVRSLEVRRGNFDDATLDDGASIISNGEIYPWIKRFDDEPCGFTNPPDGNVQAYSGNNVAFIQMDSAYDQSAIFLSQQIKDYAFILGKTYTLSAWIARVSDQAMGASIMIGRSDSGADTAPLSIPLSEAIVDLSQKNLWYFASIAYTAQPDDDGKPIYISINGEKPVANTGRVYFDDIQLTKQ